MPKKKNLKVISNLITFIILPFFVNAVLESLGSKQLWGGFHKLVHDPYIFLCNTLIIASLISVGAIFKRFRFVWISIVVFGCILLATINYMILSYRSLPFTAFDFQLLDTLPLIIKRYIDPPLLAVICLLIVAAMLGLCGLISRALTKTRQKHRLLLPSIYICFMIVLTMGNISFARSHGILETRFPNLAKSYVKNGFAYSFSISLVDRGIKRVDGYSEQYIDSITSSFPKTESQNIQTPNIIFVQLESFFNLNDWNDVNFSDNPIPNFTKLAAEYPSGLLTVPILGAGTVNTEFEVVTGMRVQDFGVGEYPYKTILKETICESIATNLKKHGYTSHFIHNYRGTFYDRNIVYENLGYDNFYSLEYMSGYSETETGWAKDDILLRYIDESMDSTKGSDLVTAVSVQAHGKYEDVTDFERHITVADCKNKAYRMQYEYYANQIYEMDAFLGNLISSISARGEDTILVIYGDHLPAFDFSEENLDGRTEFQTDYIIWNNMGIDYEDEDLYAYQIGAKVLESIYIHDGMINACHQQYKNDEQYLTYLCALEYDMLYGKRYAFDQNKNFFTADMLINRRQLRIDSIALKDGSENVYVIKGDAFTEETLVKVNYSILPAEFIDENTLKFRTNTDLTNSKISVWERDVGESNDFYMNMQDETTRGVVK